MNDVVRRYKILNEEIIKSEYDFNIEIDNKNKLIKTNKLLQKEIKKFNDYINLNDCNSILDIDKDITKEQLFKDIDELKEKLSRYPLELSKGEKLMLVIFISSDENMIYSIVCKNTEKFSKLEENLYNYYPEYSQSDNYFMINGKRINKMKSLDENEIKNNDVIILKKNKT